MDAVRNPFAPGAGTPPPELAGRAGILDDARIALQRIAVNKPTQSQILVGLRGVGKTVLLNRIKELSEQLHFKTHLVEAHEAKSLPELIVPGLRTLLFSISAIDSAKENARRALRVLKGFVGALRISINELEFGLGIDSEVGAADSGDLEADLPNLFHAIGLAASSANKPIALLIDELQYISEKEMSALIMSIHKINQENLPVVLFGAGLPQILALAGNSKSYSERLFKYPKIGALEEQFAKEAIINPALSEGVTVEDGAIQEILKVTERYPYFLQQWAHDAWNVAQNGAITLQDVLEATDQAVRTLDESFFRVRFDRCTPSEKRYMRALAGLGPGAHRSSDVADQLGVKSNTVGPTRGNLIKKGMIYSPQYGDTAFTVPLFDAYMLRVMPTI